MPAFDILVKVKKVHAQNTEINDILLPIRNRLKTKKRIKKYIKVLKKRLFCFLRSPVDM
jgi:hypothetical protein